MGFWAGDNFVCWFLPPPSSEEVVDELGESIGAWYGEKTVVKKSSSVSHSSTKEREFAGCEMCLRSPISSA